MIEHAQTAVSMLVVSKEPASLRSLWTVGEANSWLVETAASGWEALERVQSEHAPDLVLLDLGQEGSDGLHTLRWLRRVRPDVPVFLLALEEDSHQMTEAIRLGAQGYLTRPYDQERFEEMVRRHLGPHRGNGNGHGNGHSHREIATVSEDFERISDDLFFVAASPISHKLRAQAELLAQFDVPLFLVGEEGSGKETVARLVHKLSVRSGFRFLKINCAALPADLLETELFDKEHGALAGMGRQRAGKSESNDNGTVLLNEITEMPSHLQGQLLHLLQEGQSSRLRGDARVSGGVRIIASSEIEPEKALATKKLREDLYYALSAFTLQVPALRQRKEEVPLLLRHFMNQLARHYALPSHAFSSVMLDACQSYDWPGNMKELQNFVKRYLVTGDQEVAMQELAPGQHHWSGPLQTAPETANGHEFEPSEPGERSSGLKSFVQSVKGEAERNAISTALEQTHWNRKAAARLLKVSYRTLLYKIEQYRMSPTSPSYLSPFGNGSGLKGNGRH